jgi:TonB family protein
MPQLTDQNLVTYAIQLAALIVSVGVCVRAFGVTDPRARLGLLRVTLAACLLLPFLQALERSPAPLRAAALTAAANGQSAGAPSALGDRSPAADRPALPVWRFQRVLLLVAAVGAVARMAWLGAGLAGLRRLRRLSTPLSPPPSIEWAAQAVTARASFRTVPGLDHPVSFGVLSPVVIVPASFSDLDEAMQRAVACHELTHVRQRHWLHVVLEELARAALWFHPAVWWLIDQIHLAREQAVDDEVVRVTGRRRAYLDLLLRLSSADAVPAPALASAFFRRSHVKPRIAQLLKEATMSTSRRSFTVAAVTVFACATTTAATRSLPLRAGPEALTTSGAPHQAQAKGPTGNAMVPGATVDPKPVHKVLPAYPPAAAAAKVSGPVVLEVSCDTGGTPIQVDAIAGADELRAAAVDAVKQWRFEPPREPATFVVGVNVLPPASMDAIGEKVTRIGMELKPPTKIAHVNPQYPPEAKDAGLQGVVIAEVTIGANGIVQDAVVRRSVKGLDAAALLAVLQWQFTQTVLEGKAVPVLMTVTVNFTLA